MSKPKYLLNPKSGAVFPATDLLLKKATGLVACEQDGTPLSSYDALDDEDVMESAFLLNPVSGAVIPWSLLLARQEGLIPCDNQDHANRILKNLGKDELISELADAGEPDIPERAEVAGLSTNATTEEAPPEESAGEETETEPAGVEDGIHLDEIVNLEIPEILKDMTKKQIAAYAMENFGEKLDTRVTIKTLQEQAAMLMKNAELNTDDIEAISMV